MKLIENNTSNFYFIWFCVLSNVSNKQISIIKGVWQCIDQIWFTWFYSYYVLIHLIAHIIADILSTDILSPDILSVHPRRSQAITISEKMEVIGVNDPPWNQFVVKWEIWRQNFAPKHVVWRINEENRIIFTGSYRDRRRKKGRKVKSTCFDPLCPDDPSHPIVTKFGRVGIVWRMWGSSPILVSIGWLVRALWVSEILAFPSETYMAYNNYLPCTAVQACDL
jgi:hypothetical protein